MIKYVPDKCKAGELCDKVIMENGEILRFIPNYYKDQSMCDKAANNYSH